MLRFVSLKYVDCLRITLRPIQVFARLHHEKIRSSYEFIPKINKEEKEELINPGIRISDTEESLLKNIPQIGISGERKAEGRVGKGEACWKRFEEKYRSGSLTGKDVVVLLRGVYSEAQYQKYVDAPRPLYMMCCYGLIPLGSIGLLSLATGGTFPGLAYVQLSYGASIMSFMGGIAWGHFMAEQKVTFAKLGWTAVPPLLAWLALLLPIPFGFVCTSVGLATSLVHDVLLTTFPQWFKSLRYILTVTALISFLPTFFTFVL